MNDATEDPFVWQPGQVVLSQCCYCRHFRPTEYGLVCRAFPGGIPDEILHNGFDHRDEHIDEATPTQFEPKPLVSAQTLDMLARVLERNANSGAAPDG